MISFFILLLRDLRGREMQKLPHASHNTILILRKHPIQTREALYFKETLKNLS